MFSDSIEKMKSEYTDKYVVVDATRPELARFQYLVGQVKTVNMSGRALVEFDDYHLNIGWYDIDLDYLKVVNKDEVKKAPPKPAPAAKEKAGSKSAAGGAKGARPSVADMLAAARGGGAAAAAAAAPAKAKSEAKPAAAKPAGGAKMSVAEMIAAAKAGGALGAAPAPPPAGESASAAAKPAPAAPAKKAAVPAAQSSEKVDKSKMTIDDMVAWCREHDTK